jgi:hypothetical protein
MTDISSVDHQAPRRYYQSRAKLSLIAIPLLAGGLCLLWAALSSHRMIYAVVVGLFMLILVLNFIKTAIQPAVLEFDSEEICFTPPSRGLKKCFRWKDVVAVHVVNGSRYGNGVILNFKNSLSSSEDSYLIPGLWSVSNEILARRFEILRTTSQSTS